MLFPFLVSLNILKFVPNTVAKKLALLEDELEKLQAEKVDVINNIRMIKGSLFNARARAWNIEGSLESVAIQIQAVKNAKIQKLPDDLDLSKPVPGEE